MILYVFAMQSELDKVTEVPIHNGEALRLDDQHLILKTGVGKVNAAYALSKTLALHKVDYVINLGFAGATYPFEVGDVVVIDEASYHDFDLTMFGYEMGQVPGMPPKFDSDLTLLKLMKHKISHLKEAKLYTGDTFVTKNSNEHFLVDMEGAALYHVAYQYGIPIISIKVVSDVLGSNEHLEKFKNFANEKGPLMIRDIYHCL
jgi:adenosylhomocysteine nucleosidase